MNYSLGNMLSRGGALNPDGLSLDLAFAADKTLAARKGPTPTFTRASTATFVGSNGLIQSAAINAPRFDHDPVTLACKGLLIEESRSNSLLHSENFKNTTSSNYWENLSATTVTVDQIASPNGGVNADLLTTSTASFDCFVRRAGIFTGSTQYTYSIFLKQGPSGYRYVGLYIGAGVSALKFPFFDFNNPTTVQIPSGTMVGTINSTRVDAYPNGWYRVSVTFTTAATLVTTLCGVYISQSDGTIPASSAAGLNAYIWGIQVELGSFPTSYIPTAAASVLRSADVCSISGANFTGFYNQSEWTLYADLSGLMSEPLGGQRPFVAISDGTYSNFFSILKASGTGSFQAEALTSSALQFRLGNAYAPYTRYKIALGAKTDNANASYNGVLKTTDTTVTMPSTMNRLEFRDPTGAAAGHPSCHIAAIRYYKKRLPDAKLQSLTT